MTEDDLIDVNLFCAVALDWARGRVQLYVEQIDRQDRVMEVGAITGFFADYNRAWVRPHKVPGRLPQGQATPRALPLEQDGEVSGGSCNRFESHVTSRLAACMR